MPEYNVEYSIELAYNVNDVAIKSYDIKKDDNILFDKQLFGMIQNYLFFKYMA